MTSQMPQSREFYFQHRLIAKFLDYFDHYHFLVLSSSLLLQHRENLYNVHIHNPSLLSGHHELLNIFYGARPCMLFIQLY